jgi:uncharacterized protein YecE (DUF72 family)
MSEQSCVVYLGVVGWMHEDWKGIVYPRTPPKGFDPLEHLARYLDCVELDDTSFHPLTPFMAQRWTQRTAHNARFRFVVRAWQRFTHQREILWSAADASAFKRGIDPLADGGRLGALLFQFPQNFRFDDKGRAWLHKVWREFADYQRLIEFRHSSWLAADALDLLRELQFGFCAVQPSLFLREEQHIVTSVCGALRLQGRAVAEEHRTTDSVDFMFGADEIARFAQRAKTLARECDSLFVTFANHGKAQSVVNALQLRAALMGKPAAAPPELRNAYQLGAELKTD